MVRWLVLERVKEEGVQVVSVAVASASSWRRQRWQWPAFPVEDRGMGELDLERERDVSAEKKRGNSFPDQRQPSPLPTIFSGLGAQQWRDELVSMAASVCSERGSGGEANEWQGRVPGGVFELYMPRWAWSMVLREWKRLGVVGGSPGRRCALVSGVRSLVGVAGWFGRNGLSFRIAARETVRNTASWVG
jgi:hypothetical protein